MTGKKDRGWVVFDLKELPKGYFSQRKKFSDIKQKLTCNVEFIYELILRNGQNRQENNLKEIKMIFEH